MKDFDSRSSVYPMSCQLHDIGDTEDQLSNDSLFPRLARKQFTFRDDRVLLSQKTEQLRAAKLLVLLPTRGPKAFQIFLDCLREFNSFCCFFKLKED